MRTPTTRRIAAAIGAASITVGLLLFSIPAEAGVGNRVSICHRTHSQTNPYRRITVAKQSGHSGHSGGVWFLGALAWGDIIPSGFQPMNSLNYSGAGLTIYQGTTSCRQRTAVEFITFEIAAGQSMATVLADLDDQGATEDAATLAALGGSFSTTLANKTLAEVQSALAVATPVVVTGIVSAMSNISASIAGTSNPAAATNTLANFFEYGTDPLLTGATRVAAAPTSTTGSTTTAISQSLTGLTPSTTYYYRAVGVFTDSGSGATADYPGSILSFVTLAAATTSTTSTSTTTSSTTSTSTTSTTTTMAEPTSTTVADPTTTSTTDVTTTTEPTTTTTTTVEPTTSSSTVAEPTTSTTAPEPTTTSSTTTSSTTTSSTTVPSTSTTQPTTLPAATSTVAEPSTSSSTTAVPTTAVPTTVAPSSVAPISSGPTTEPTPQPTVAPTSVSPLPPYAFGPEQADAVRQPEASEPAPDGATVSTQPSSGSVTVPSTGQAGSPTSNAPGDKPVGKPGAGSGVPTSSTGGANGNSDAGTVLTLVNGAAPLPLAAGEPVRLSGLVPGASVSVIDVHGSTVLAAVADANGAVVLPVLPVGEYTLRTLGIDNEPVSMTLQVLGRYLLANELALTGGGTTAASYGLILVLLGAGLCMAAAFMRRRCESL